MASWLFLALLGIIWAVCVVPWTRGRSPAGSVQDFERGLDLLADTGRAQGRWIVAPRFLWEPGLVALLAFIAVMVVTGFSDLKNLDWDYLVFFGVALTIADLADGLNIGKYLGDLTAAVLSQLGLGGAAFVLLVGVLTIVVKSLLAADQAILLLALPLLPVADHIGISPWLAAIAILSLGLSWHLPAQPPESLVAYGATHGRLYSHQQARKMAFAYQAIALAGLAVCLPYWHVLGLL